MILTVDSSLTVQELTNQALAFTKYSGDTEAMDFLNEILSELKWIMKANDHKNFVNRINTMLIA